MFLLPSLWHQCFIDSMKHFMENKISETWKRKTKNLIYTKSFQNEYTSMKLY